MKRMLMAAIAVVLGFNAQAVYVRKNISSGDTRNVTVNSTFSNVIDRAVSAGIWVKDLSGFSTTASLMGCAHVNASTDTKRGFVVLVHDSSRLEFNLNGDDANGVRKSYGYVQVTKDLSWCTDGKWHFVMFTCDCDAGEAKVYLDGECLKTTAIELATIRPERCYSFGGGMAGTTEKDGTNRDSYGAAMLNTFAEATVYNRALSAEEVRELATRRARVDADGLIAYWPCNESSGGTVNWALHPATRADGVVVTGYAYYTDYADDADFFPMPSGYFVVTPEWAAANGYVMAADCKANTLAQPATNIQYALDKATTSGAIVNLLPGTYYPTMTLSNKCASLTLRSYNPDTGDYDREGTVIDGSRLTSGSMLNNNGKATPVIRALTFCNTTAARGVYLKSAGKFKVLDCTFTNLTSTSYGSGVYCYTCAGGVISNCLFRTCKGSVGGGVYTIQNAVRSDTDLITISDSDFEDCIATEQGGGLYSDRHNDVIGCTFRDCRVVASAAGSRKGGSLYVGGKSVVSGCLFTGATGVKPLSGNYAYGGIINADDGEIVITNCLITGCSYTSGGFGAIRVASRGATTIVDVICTNNNINSQFVFAEGDVPNTVIRNCLVAKAGGTGPTALVTGHQSPLVRVENVTCDLDAIWGTGGAFSTNVFVNSILCGTFNASSGAHVSIVSNCCLAAATTGALDSGVVVGPPKFVDAANGDYSIKRSSPARDQALCLPWMTADATDLAGNPRVVTDGKTLAENPNAKPDMGCYECLLEPVGAILIFR